MDNSVREQIHFNGFLDWFIQATPVEPLWRNQPTYLIAQTSYLLGGVFSLIHALRGGGRLRYLWLATIVHGLAVESLCYVLPDVDNFWHSQTPLMFLGRRLPLHILLLYPCFIYQASVAAAQLKLPKWAEPFAVGLLVVLIDAPYITSVKFVHWTWHDTDPNIADRHYWVPWNSYYFHLTFAASFTFWFHATRRWLDNKTPKFNVSGDCSGVAGGADRRSVRHHQCQVCTLDVARHRPQHCGPPLLGTVELLLLPPDLRCQLYVLVPCYSALAGQQDTQVAVLKIWCGTDQHGGSFYLGPTGRGGVVCSLVPPPSRCLPHSLRSHILHSADLLCAPGLDSREDVDPTGA
uniref:DUF7802 domain-containing protein n=1 Tax=Graphocephala atropunctata TaxID=36148 RepID=A0A1B6L3L5_9HEMI